MSDLVIVILVVIPVIVGTAVIFYSKGMADGVEKTTLFYQKWIEIDEESENE